MIFTDSSGIRKNKTGGGVSIFVRIDHKASLLSDFTFNVSNLIKVNLPEFKINVCGVYRPLDSKDLNDFKNLLNKLDSILEQSKNTFLFGDFNVHLLDLRNDETIAYNNAISANGYSIYQGVLKLS